MEPELLDLYYVRKTNYSHIKIVINEKEIEEFKMSPFETILFIVKRLSGIYSKDEEYLINKKLNLPLEYYCRDGGANGDKFYSLTQMRNLVKTWRKANAPQFSDHEYQEIVREVNLGLQKLTPPSTEPGRSQRERKSPVTGEETEEFQANMTVTWTDQNLSALPLITAYLPGAGGELQRHPVVIDTGASVSILPSDKFRAWGLDPSLLNKKHVLGWIKVNTYRDSFSS